MLAKTIEEIDRRHPFPFFVEANRRSVRAQYLPQFCFRPVGPYPEQSHHRPQGLRIDIHESLPLAWEEYAAPLPEGVSEADIVVAWLGVYGVMVMVIPDSPIFAWAKQ